MEKISAAYLTIAAGGIALAIYTSYEYVTQSFNSCNINQVFNCGGVYASGHTSLFGIPFYATGLVWFPMIFLIGLLTSRLGRTPVNGEILLPLLMLGNVFTAYLWYLELVVIHIICPLCVSLYAINYALTAIAVISIIKSEPSDSYNN
ncbi:vitamin K epoxide reductase family protein [Candidatus Bathyarchaeota archaeon]|nr:vitamin K epoxide reductase family protein [Candidatus Bathyarchaeota archaeon]